MERSVPEYLFHDRPIDVDAPNESATMKMYEGATRKIADNFGRAASGVVRIHKIVFQAPCPITPVWRTLNAKSPDIPSGDFFVLAACTTALSRRYCRYESGRSG